MKDYSCAQIKRGFKTAIQQLPKEGSKVRQLYDLFMEYKGQIIQFDYDGLKYKSEFGTRIKYLQVMYGLDIAHVGLRKFRLAGEWIGPKYVSYEVKQPLKIKVKGASYESSKQTVG